MGWLFPNETIYFNFLFPIKVKWFVLFYAAKELFFGFSNTAGDNVAHWAHLGGGLAGLLLVLYWNRTDRRNFY
jgi:membrane associated rhomboid family serine protease